MLYRSVNPLIDFGRMKLANANMRAPPHEQRAVGKCMQEKQNRRMAIGEAESERCSLAPQRIP